MKQVFGHNYQFEFKNTALANYNLFPIIKNNNLQIEKNDYFI